MRAGVDSGAWAALVADRGAHPDGACILGLQANANALISLAAISRWFAKFLIVFNGES
jgi:hypothetical protein